MGVELRKISAVVPRTDHVPSRRATGVATAVLATSLLLSACGTSAAAAPWKASAILSADRVAQTVHLRLDASAMNGYSGFNFDGYGGGAMRVNIPLGWTVDVTCKNDSTTFTHSCAVVEDQPISPIDAPLAFPGASSPNPTNGLAFGASASFSFVASRLGRFRIDCLVSGHEADGMWDWLEITAGGLPSVTT